MGGNIQEAEQARARLEEKFPGWEISFVFYPDGTVTWRAQPRPRLAAGSPEELAAKINQAHEAVASHAALANRADYSAVAPGVTQAGDS